MYYEITYVIGANMANSILLVGFDKNIASNIFAQFPEILIKALPQDFSSQELSDYAAKADYIFINGSPKFYVDLALQCRTNCRIFPEGSKIKYCGPEALNLHPIWENFINRQVFVFGLPPALHTRSLREIADCSGAELSQPTKDSFSLEISYEHKDYLAGFIFRQLFSFLPATLTRAHNSNYSPKYLFSKVKSLLKVAGRRLRKVYNKDALTMDDLQGMLNGLSAFAQKSTVEIEKIYRKSDVEIYNRVKEVNIDTSHPLKQLYPEKMDRHTHRWLEVTPRILSPFFDFEYFMRTGDRPVRQISNEIHGPGSKVFLLPHPENIEDVLLPICAVLGSDKTTNLQVLSVLPSPVIAQQDMSVMLSPIPEMPPIDDQSVPPENNISKSVKNTDSADSTISSTANHIAPNQASGNLRELYKSKHPKKTFSIIGDSLAMELLYRQIIPVLNDKAGHVLIMGEAGTGKELVANLIKEWQGDALQSVNCSHLTANIAHSNLFGYVDGAFTGAKKGGTPGYIYEQGRGSLFLDEIQALPEEVMAMLLRYLEGGEFVRMGDTKVRKSSIRIIAASNDDQMLHGKFVSSGFISRFRYVIRVPSLKYRRDDIKNLVQHFVEKAKADLKLPCSATISEHQIEVLKNTDWRHSNVRGLKNAVYNLLARRAYSAISSGKELQSAPDVVVHDVHPAKPNEKENKAGCPTKISDDMLREMLVEASDAKELQVKLRSYQVKNKVKGEQMPYPTRQAMTRRINESENRDELEKLFERFKCDYPKKTRAKREKISTRSKKINRW